MAESRRPLSLPKQPEKSYTKPTRPDDYTPTHPDLFLVEFASTETNDKDDRPNGESASSKLQENFSSRLVAVKDFSPHTTITPLTNLSQAGAKAYSSVQYGPGEHDHLELNTDLLFMNHSCDPTVHVYLSPAGEWKVKTGPRGLKKGEDLTFFYPSTEWSMAQPFDCGCGATECLRQVNGARDLTLDQLSSHGYINEHILKLKAEQQAVKSRSNSRAASPSK